MSHPDPCAATVAAIADFGRTSRHAPADDLLLQGARAARDAATEALAALQAREQLAWDDYRNARDRLVSLGAPPVRENSLQDAWTSLVDWADEEVRTREATSIAARAALSAAERHRSQTNLVLREALDRVGIGAPTDQSVAKAVSVAVATELERARAQVQIIQSQLGQLADLQSRQDTADDEHAVAHMLSNLLRSNEFPRWLVASALDVLVQDA